MDLWLSDEQAALQDAVASVCARLFTSERVRALSATAGVDRSSWAALADIGLFSLRLPEPDGAGLGTAEAVLALEQLGRSFVPGPLVANVLAAGVVDGVADGAVVVGLMDRDEDPLIAEHLDALDLLLVLDDGGVVAVAPSDLTATALPDPADPLTPVHHVTGIGEGTRVGGPELAARWRLDGAVLTAGLQVGLAQQALDLAVTYARHREQFGQPIGQFQAVKHMLADALARVEIARSAVYAAAVTLDDPEVGEAARRVSAAKLLADEAAVGNGRTGVQVHGGMGFTWEVDAHLPLRRAWVYATHFGSADDHAELLAEMV
jgi:alkylation response protein AidB-like acyl-CoA dehydrogenase